MRVLRFTDSIIGFCITLVDALLKPLQTMDRYFFKASFLLPAPSTSVTARTASGRSAVAGIGHLPSRTAFQNSPFH